MELRMEWIRLARMHCGSPDLLLARSTRSEWWILLRLCCNGLSRSVLGSQFCGRARMEMEK